MTGNHDLVDPRVQHEQTCREWSLVQFLEAGEGDSVGLVDSDREALRLEQLRKDTLADVPGADRQLAERAQLSPDTIRRLEHGGFTPGLGTVDKLCRGLGMSLGTFFVGFERGGEGPS